MYNMSSNTEIVIFNLELRSGLIFPGSYLYLTDRSVTSLIASTSIDGGRVFRYVSYFFDWAVMKGLFDFEWKHCVSSLTLIDWDFCRGADLCMELDQKIHGKNIEKWNFVVGLYTKSLCQPTAKTASVFCSFCKAISTSSAFTFGNSGTPLGHKKHLKPTTPSSTIAHSSFSFPGITPPQNATSTKTLPRATSLLIFKFSTVVVGGMEFLQCYV